MENYDNWKLQTPEEDSPITEECNFCGKECNEGELYCSPQCYSNDLK